MEPKDFHPGSGGKVQNLIHPSLCKKRLFPRLILLTCNISSDPYMADVTPIPPSVTPPPTVNGRFITQMREKHESESEVDMESVYAWVPAVFSVSEDGSDVSLEGYINGLGTRQQYPVMYKLVETVFKVVMPILERTVCFDTATIGQSRNDFCECTC
jgi:hypothetical protein